MVVRVIEEGWGDYEPPEDVVSQQPSIIPAGAGGTLRGPVTIITSGGEAVAVSPEDLTRTEAITVLETGGRLKIGEREFYGKPKEVADPTKLSVTKYTTSERREGETAGAYHARTIREEIAFEKSQPYKQLGPRRTLREYGVVDSSYAIEGYEGLEVKPKKIRPTVSRVKAEISRTFFPDVREVREMEALGIDVPFEKKFRAEAQKFIPTLFISGGLGYVAGAGVSLLPQAVQAMKIRTALVLGIPAGVGIYKGIKQKEYGMVIGSVIGAAYGYPRGYKFGATKIKPYLQTRFKPVKVQALTETTVRRLPEGEKYLGITKGKYQAKIGKKTYTGEIKAVTGIEKHPLIDQPKMYVYKGEVYAKVAKWDILKLKSFAKKTGLTIAEIKSRVGSGELGSGKFIKYTKPVKAKYAGAISPTQKDYISETIIRPKKSSMGATLEYGRKYLDIGKSRFYRAVGREFKPKFKGPASDIKLIQKVTLKKSVVPSEYIGPQPYQVTTITTPQIQKIVGPQILKSVSKAVKLAEVKRIAGQFKPQRRLLPVVTPTKKITLPTTKLQQKQKQKQMLKQRVKVQPLLIQIEKQKTKQKQVQVSGVIQLQEQQQRQKQIQQQTQIEIQQQKQKQRLALGIPSPTVTPFPVTPVVPYVPPYIPIPTLPLGFRGRGKRRIPVRARYGYTPSYSAFVFKIYGRKAEPAFKGRYTGFQLRPITKKFRWSKLIPIVRRRRKKK